MKIRKWVGFFLAAFILAGLHVNAQQQRTLTITEAINLAVQNSGQLEVSQAKIDEMLASLKQANDARLPEAGVTASHIRLNSPNIDLKVKSSNTSGSTSEPTKISSATYGLFNVSLPLYAGHRIKYGIEAAKYLAEAAKLDAQNDKEAVILNTINAFANLYKAKAAADLVQENLNSAKERVKQFTSLEKNGLLARNDLLKASLQQSNTELSLLDAQNNWQLANIAMNLMLRLPETTELVPDAGTLTRGVDLLSVEEYVQNALQNRKDKAALDLRKRAASTQVKAVRGELHPSIALTGGYVAANVPNLLTVYNAVNVGVGVKYSLSSLWKNKAKVQQAQAAERQVAASQSMLEDNIRYQVNQAYQGYLLSKKKIDVYQVAVNQATENFTIVKNKYDNALATTTDLLDADVAQLQAKLNYAFSKSDATVAYSNLLQTAGLLSN